MLAGSACCWRHAMLGGTAAMLLACAVSAAAGADDRRAALVAVNWVFVCRCCRASRHTSRRPRSRRSRSARRARRSHRHLQRRAAEPRLLPAAPHRRSSTTTARCSNCSQAGRAVPVGATGDDYERAIGPAVAGAALPRRLAADIRREAAQMSRRARPPEVLLLTNRLWKPPGWCTRGRLAARGPRSDDRD